MKLQFSIFLFSICSLVFSQEQDKFIGKWKNKQGTVIEIYTINESRTIYCGKIISIQKNNSFQKVNDVIIISMKKANSEKLIGGTFFDEEKGTEYECRLKLNNDHKLTIVIIHGFFTKRRHWQKVID